MPDSLAIKGELISLSYAQLLFEIIQSSIIFRNNSPRCIGILLDNSPAWAIIDCAALHAKIPIVPLPLFFSKAQLLHAIQTAGIDYLITDQAEFLETLIASSPLNITRKEEITVGKQGLTAFVISNNTKVSLPIGTAKITYTSGTTGNPKGVCLSQNMIEAVMRSLAQATQANQYDHHYCILPLSTLLENLAGLYVPLMVGASVGIYSMKKNGLIGASGLNLTHFMQAIAKSNASTLILIPELLLALVSAVEQGFGMPKKIRFVAVGGASVSPQLLARGKHVGIPIYEGYGLSECGSVVALNTPIAHQVGSVGKPLAHINIRFSDDQEILVRGAQHLGYVAEPPTSVSSDYLATGDIGYMDEAGFLYINGRKKNIFITSFGRNVSPEWVERELILTTAIKQAALFGEAKPWNVAVIVPTMQANIASIQAAIDTVNVSLPDYARVTNWITAETAFSTENRQLTSNGRLRRNEIWQHYESKINAIYKEQHYGVL